MRSGGVPLLGGGGEDAGLTRTPTSWILEVVTVRCYHIMELGEGRWSWVGLPTPQLGFSVSPGGAGQRFPPQPVKLLVLRCENLHTGGEQLRCRADDLPTLSEPGQVVKGLCGEGSGL